MVTKRRSWTMILKAITTPWVAASALVCMTRTARLGEARPTVPAKL